MFEQMETLQPVILAGGDDSRMGYNKALASFEGTTLIETIYTLLDFVFDKSPMVVTNDKAIFKDIDCLKDALIVEDVYKGAQTLGAVATAFQYTDAENIFVIGVNMPFVSVPMIEKMSFHIQAADAVVPVQDGTDICLHAVYNRRLMPLMRKKIAEGNHLLHSFFPQIDLVQIPVRKDKQEDAIFFDVHTPMDLKMAEEQYESIKETEPEAFQPYKRMQTGPARSLVTILQRLFFVPPVREQRYSNM